MADDWKNVVVILIPKQGELRCCDNWWGIGSLDVVGKIMVRIVKERLEQITDRVIPESQNVFQKGRGCTDMFARQLVEKAWEHNDT